MGLGVKVLSIQLVGEVTVEDVELVIDQLQKQAATLSGSDASTRLSRVSVVSAKLNAYRMTLVSTINSSQVWRESDLNGTAASFLRREHTLDHGEAKAALRTAQSFEEFPKLAEACQAGTVSREKAEAIAAVGLSNPVRSQVFGEFVEIFTELAPQVSTRELKETLRLWADQVDPVATSGEEHHAHQRRELHIHQLGDGVRVDGFFGPDQGLKLMTAINAAISAHHRAHPEQAGRAVEDGPAGPAGIDTYRIANTAAAARADAFIESIIDPVLESGLLPTCGGAPATVCVTVPLARLEDPTAPAESADVKDWINDGSLRLRAATARATNGPGDLLISSAKAQQLACDATIQRVILSPKGKPLDIGRRTRVIPEQIRAALVIRDQSCVFPYCDRPSGWAEGHHTRHWSQGGPTNLDNLVLRCAKHHHQMHAQSIPIEFDHDGKPRVVLEHQFRDRL